MKLIVAGLVQIIVIGFMYRRIPTWLPKYNGYQLFLGGILLGTVGWLIQILADYISNYFINTALTCTGIIAFLCGFGIAIFGFFRLAVKGININDARREVDPGYDLNYLLCPHCHKSQIRVDAKPYKCPVCNQSPKNLTNR